MQLRTPAAVLMAIQHPAAIGCPPKCQLFPIWIYRFAGLSTWHKRLGNVALFAFICFYFLRLSWGFCGLADIQIPEVFALLFNPLGIVSKDSYLWNFWKHILALCGYILLFTHLSTYTCTSLDRSRRHISDNNLRYHRNRTFPYFKNGIQHRLAIIYTHLTHRRIFTFNWTTNIIYLLLRNIQIRN